MMDIVFVVEGGPDAGLGHVYHSTAIADALQDDVNPIFVTRSGEETQQKIHEKGYELRTANNETMAEVISQLSPSVVVFDVPWLESERVATIHDSLELGVRLVAIGNRNNNLPEGISKYCDVVIDFDIGGSSRPSGRFYDESSQTLNLVGLRYLVLRPGFYEKKKESSTSEHLSRVLIIFGASDPSNFTSTALTKLLERDSDFEVEIILGAGFTHDDDFASALESYPDEQHRVTVSNDVENVADYMLEADVVITSPGLTMMEALLLGKPVVAFYQNELQKIWSEYPFVHAPDQLENLLSILHKTHTSFDEITSDLNLDFFEGKQQVLDAIRWRIDG
jgi:spore coat polysaccharide biosynthesis predicted glycosyltransferase SpsG